jgi:hypothetical protein
LSRPRSSFLFQLCRHLTSVSFLRTVTMRFNVAAALSAAVLVSGGYADDAQKVLSEDASSSAAETSTAVAPEMPVFTVSSPQNALGSETFSLLRYFAIQQPASAADEILNSNASSCSLTLNSRPKSRQTSLSSSPTTGASDGSSRMLRKTQAAPMTTLRRSGHTLASGLSRSQLSTLA